MRDLETLVEHINASVRTFDYPASWTPGQLLDLKRFSDGSFKAYRMGEDGKEDPFVHFDSSHSAQAFVSWWYASPQGRH